MWEARGNKLFVGAKAPNLICKPKFNIAHNFWHRTDLTKFGNLFQRNDVITSKYDEVTVISMIFSYEKKNYLSASISSSNKQNSEHL